MSSISQKEAIYLFTENTVSQGFWLSEFEQIVKDQVQVDKFKDTSVKAAYVVIGAQDFAQAIVLFTLPINDKGFVNSGWYLPLRRLADNAGHGPNMGDGRIRLACHSQCSISWHKDSLWEPVTSDFMAIRKAIRDNLIGQKPLSLSGQETSGLSQTLAKSTIASALSKPHEDPEVEQLKAELKSETLAYRNQLQQLQREIERQKAMSEKVQRQVSDEDLAQELADIKKIHLHEMQLHQQEMGELKQALALQQEANEALQLQFGKKGECEVSEEVEALQQQVQELTMELAVSKEHSIQHFIDRVDALEAVLVCFHPGAGHLTISAESMRAYAENPTAYAANKCHVEEALYVAWLDHYDNPVCQQCRCEIPRIESPHDYNPKRQGFCQLHRSMTPVNEVV